MGKLIPVLAAYILLCCGLQYFREPRKVGPGPLVSSYIFMFAAFLLLWDIRLYPRSLRRLGIISQCIVEFVVASFLFENIMVDFWFPLELVVLELPMKLSDLLEDMVQTGNWNCDVVCDVLKKEMTSFVASYILSTFLLLTILHATRAIDLRELENGPGAFIMDIVNRAKRYFKRQKRLWGIGMKKKVHIKELKDKRGGTVEITSSKTETDICPGMGPSRQRSSNFKNSNGSSRTRSVSKRRSPCDTDLKYTFSDFEMALRGDK